MTALHLLFRHGTHLKGVKLNLHKNLAGQLDDVTKNVARDAARFADITEQRLAKWTDRVSLDGENYWGKPKK